jgi:2-polyprenyl-3-methyl-5-hydroxy-6-metoxy-1,4-benzoquinol methylase
MRNMGYLDYYKYQTMARGIRSVDDVIRDARSKAHVYRQIVLPWLPPNKSVRIAELACGHGSLLYWLKNQGFACLTGVDSSEEQIALAIQVGVPVHNEDVNGWLQRKRVDSFDVLLAIDLIEHLSKDEFMQFLKTTHHALAAAGRLILRYPNGDSPLVGLNLFNDITHVWTYTSNCLQTLAAMHGFAQALFVDESHKAIRDHRWLKVPLSKLSATILSFLFRAAGKETTKYWSPHMWACLVK